MVQLRRTNRRLEMENEILRRAANHRETILNLPGLTQADISEVYDKFTALRLRNERERCAGMPLLDHAYAVARNG